MTLIGLISKYLLQINNNYHHHNNYLIANNNKNDLINVRSIEFASATFGGILSSFVSSPMELCMIQQQLHGGSLYSTSYHIINTYGYQSIMRGYISCALRDGIYVSGMLGLTPMVQRYLIDTYRMDVSLVSIIEVDHRLMVRWMDIDGMYVL